MVLWTTQLPTELFIVIMAGLFLDSTLLDY
jgi:hypothetical protein